MHLTVVLVLIMKLLKQRGYFKLDLLNQSVYTLIRDQAHYDEMLVQQTGLDQTFTRQSSFVNSIVHIGNYHDLIVAMKPDSVQRMAAFISIIRPGKAHLQRKPWAGCICNCVGW